MTPRSALDVLKQAAAKFLGTLEDHNTLQEAARILDDAITELEQHQQANKPAEPVHVNVDAPAPQEAEVVE